MIEHENIHENCMKTGLKSNPYSLTVLFVQPMKIAVLRPSMQLHKDENQLSGHLRMDEGYGFV